MILIFLVFLSYKTQLIVPSDIISLHSNLLLVFEKLNKCHTFFPLNNSQRFKSNNKNIRFYLTFILPFLTLKYNYNINNLKIQTISGFSDEYFYSRFGLVTAECLHLLTQIWKKIIQREWQFQLIFSDFFWKSFHLGNT